MKRSASIVRGPALLAAVTLVAGCGSKNDNYDQLCVDQVMIRVDDHECEPEHHPYHWYYVHYPYGSALPAHPVGSRVTTPGTNVRPATGSFYRGGFGGTSGGGGG